MLSTKAEMNVADAVARPRFHHQRVPDRLQVEPASSPDVIAQLKTFGHHVEIVPQQGDAAAITIDNDWLEGAADPRTEATTKGY